MFASGLKDLMENGGKEKQFFASQTGKTPVSGGKGWQFFASIFSKTKNLDANPQGSKQKPASQNTGNRDFGGKSPDSEVRQTSTTALNGLWWANKKGVRSVLVDELLEHPVD